MKLTALVLVALPVFGHHSFCAEFDPRQPVTIKGTFVRVEYVNPHPIFYIDVKGEDGTVTHWTVEGAPPNTLRRMGLERDFLKQGDSVTIVGFRARNGTNLAGVGRISANGNEWTMPYGWGSSCLGESPR